MDADLGGDAGHDQVANRPGPEDPLEVRRVERALAGLVDDRLARQRPELVDDVVTVLPAHEDPAHGARIADPDLEPAAGLLRRRAIAEIRTVSLARVDDAEPKAPERLEHAPGRLDDPAERGDVVAEQRAEAAGLEEIPLHVDDGSQTNS